MPKAKSSDRAADHIEKLNASIADAAELTEAAAAALDALTAKIKHLERMQAGWRQPGGSA